MKILTKLFAVALLASTIGCFAHERRDCREHENWNGGSCRADVGYEHYWDHPDHRDWHPAGDHHDDHHDGDHHDDDHH
jgi:hypothetical protein